jgi:hypothetical protein
MNRTLFFQLFAVALGPNPKRKKGLTVSANPFMLREFILLEAATGFEPVNSGFAVAFIHFNYNNINRL